MDGNYMYNRFDNKYNYIKLFSSNPMISYWNFAKDNRTVTEKVGDWFKGGLASLSAQRAARLDGRGKDIARSEGDKAKEEVIRKSKRKANAREKSKELLAQRQELTDSNKFGNNNEEIKKINRQLKGIAKKYDFRNPLQKLSDGAKEFVTKPINKVGEFIDNVSANRAATKDLVRASKGGLKNTEGIKGKNLKIDKLEREIDRGNGNQHNEEKKPKQSEHVGDNNSKEIPKSGDQGTVVKKEVEQPKESDQSIASVNETAKDVAEKVKDLNTQSSNTQSQGNYIDLNSLYGNATLSGGNNQNDQIKVSDSNNNNNEKSKLILPGDARYNNIEEIIKKNPNATKEGLLNSIQQNQSNQSITGVNETAKNVAEKIGELKSSQNDVVSEKIAPSAGPNNQSNSASTSMYDTTSISKPSTTEALDKAKIASSNVNNLTNPSNNDDLMAKISRRSPAEQKAFKALMDNGISNDVINKILDQQVLNKQSKAAANLLANSGYDVSSILNPNPNPQSNTDQQSGANSQSGASNNQGNPLSSIMDSINKAVGGGNTGMPTIGQNIEKLANTWNNTNGNFIDKINNVVNTHGNDLWNQYKGAGAVGGGALLLNQLLRGGGSFPRLSSLLYR